jgi:hypothetical protein
MKFNYEQFVVDIKAVCDQHGVEIAGTCDSEGIYGEITIERKGDATYKGWNERKFNFSEGTTL